MKESVSFKWHSSLGIAIGIFILIAALSGSVIAFYHSLDTKINPWQISTPHEGQQATDPLSHIAKIEQSVEGSKVSWISLSLSHESSWHYFLAPQNIAKPIAESKDIKEEKKKISKAEPKAEKPKNKKDEPVKKAKKAVKSALSNKKNK
jgi:hypothetical protein